jgi:copper chaperone NosL
VRWDSRLIAALGALLLLPAYVLPLWSIRLVAPQYKEGLGMFIGLRDIWGHTEHDIQNINILNHYIGMRAIVPSEVDVLTIMPWLVGGLVVLGVIAALIGRRFAVAGWLALFAALGAAGLYEFWTWNYEYGHNLSPDAPIKVPGMTYQPPLIGTTTLLTIKASSYPSWGSLFLGLGFLAGILALVNERRPLLRLLLRQSLLGAAAFGLLGATACGEVATTKALAEAPAADVAFEGPGQPCDYCPGTIPETRFGGELRTAERTYRFMSIECLAGFLLSGRVAEGEIRDIRVVDYNRGDRLIDARTARYVRADFQDSPNGLDLFATATDRVAGNIHYFLGGERMTWDEVLAYVKREWRVEG